MDEPTIPIRPLADTKPPAKPEAPKPEAPKPVPPSAAPKAEAPQPKSQTMGGPPPQSTAPKVQPSPPKPEAVAPQPKSQPAPKVDPKIDPRIEPWLEPRLLGDARVYGRFSIVSDTPASHVAALCRLERGTLWRERASWETRKVAKTALGPLWFPVREALLARRS